MSDANDNEKGENVMSVMKGKKVNDVEKRRVRDERLEEKRDISKKTDSIVLKKKVKRKKESNNDVRIRDPESLFAKAIESSEHCCSTNNDMCTERDSTHMRFILNYLRYNGSMPEAIIPRDRRNLTEILHEA
ncbi:hypothetical protein ACJMK2_029143 [Sinanodonta woodiana]|uniref:Uncharacterized protein n=1 Tax=Sinanodonta woodiana TaxID=1069815 RepID=A0ABD3X9B4_SINWO